MRVTVIGTSGSGKTTFARSLAVALGVPHIELDAINWQPGWHDLNTHDPATFRRQVALAVAPQSWVSDGNYGLVRDLVLARATHLIWLDYSRARTMRRVFWRSLKRAALRREIWPGTGNRERFGQWFDKEHPIRWAWDSYAAHRDAFGAMIENPELAHIGRHRVRHPREAAAVIRELQSLRAADYTA